MVPQISGKRAATSPLSSDFDKRPKLGLSDEELEELNTGLAYLAYLPVSIPEHVTPQYLVLTFHEIATHSSTIDKSWMDRNVCIKFVDRLQSEERLNFASMWIEGRREKDWSKYANYFLMLVQHPNPSPLSDELLPRVSIRQSESATMDSWDIDYVGNANNLLFDHIKYFYEKDSNFARYTSIVQSSGMGKSRTIDELSKNHLLVPLNLREDSNGFPPPDTNVRDWLLGSTTKMEAFTRAHGFLHALFVTLLRCLKEIVTETAAISSVSDGESLEAKFRHLMTVGQTFAHQGSRRKQFYENVLKLANEAHGYSKKSLSPLTSPSTPPLSPQLSSRSNEDAAVDKAKQQLTEVVEPLMEFLLPGFNVMKTYPPALIISFDEAHPLAKIEDESWSRFSELRRALQLIHSYPCFSVFLSTTGKVNQFMPQPRYDISNRVQQGLLRLVPPFCELGFDQLAKKARSGMTLDAVASLEFMATLSRPLFAGRFIKGDADVKKSIVIFAGEKLLCRQFPSTAECIRKLTDVEKMACISVRIPLEFNTRSLRSEQMERTLVEKHLRVCLRVDPGFETVITVAPSSPLLAEASYLLMRDPVFDLPRCLLSELELSGLNKGDRGELIGMTLCLMARDAAAKRLDNTIVPVVDFIQELLTPSAEVLCSKPVRLRTPQDANKTLQETFRGSSIYFNHFIKLRDPRCINRKYLLRLIARGAAALCADFQYGIDIVIPFLFWDRILQQENVTAFILQIKNNQGFQANPCEWVFDLMNPYNIGFLDESETNPVPIIRMVFSLASTTPAVVVLQRPERTQPAREGAFRAKFQADGYTSFDIWCARASHETFLPIKDDIVFNNILLRSRVFPDVYERKESDGLQNATRSMNPGTDVHPAHWLFFE